MCVLLIDFSKNNYSFISLCLQTEIRQKVEKLKGAEYFRKAQYIWMTGKEMPTTQS